MLHRALSAGLSLALLVFAVACAQAQVTVLDLENRALPGRELALSGDGSITITDLGGRQKTLPCEEVAEIAFPRDASRPGASLIRFEFSNGDVWFGEPAESLDSGVRIKCPDFGVLEIKFEQIDRIIAPGGEAMIPADQKREDADIVWKRNKDSDHGSIRQIDSHGLTFHSDLFNKDYAIPLADLAAIQLGRLADPPAEGDRLLAIVTGQRGSHVEGILKELSTKQVVLESLYGETLTIPGACVASIYFKNGRVVYLSDLTPTRVVERPFFEVAGSDQLNGVAYLFPYRRDQAVAGGGKLSIKGKEYRKGLGVHAYSELTYALGGKFASFQATAGIDDSAAPTELVQPSVRFSVLVDGKKVWESGVIMWGSPETPVSIPVKDAGSLTLIVDFAGDGDSLDRAAWGGARLVR